MKKYALHYIKEKQDPNMGNNHIAVISTKVSRCQRQFQPLPVTRAAGQWLQVTGKP